MAIRFVDRSGRFPEVVKLAPLVGDAGQGTGDRAADRTLAVGDHATDGDRQRVAYLRDEGSKVRLGGTQQAPGEQDLPGQAITQRPQDLVSHVRLQSVEREDDLSLRGQPGLEALLIGQMEREEFLVPVQLLGDTAFTDAHATLDERLMYLRHTLVLAVAQGAHQRDDIQPELAVR